MTMLQSTDELICDTAAFYPVAPKDFDDANINEVLIEDLMYKALLMHGVLSGREIAELICFPYQLINPLLMDLKSRQFVAHRTTATMGDFFYSLTDAGKQNAKDAKENSNYCGPAPVNFDDYVKSVALQSIRNESPTPDDVKAAFNDLVVEDEVLETVGPAIISGRGLFLFGEPGNGKTSIAERICRTFGDEIYIPKAIWAEGDIIQLYDPQTHEAVPMDHDNHFDERWVKIKRPTVMVGGELTMDALEIKYNETTKVSEAPLQMKANGGIFLIDDFGRQRVATDELLNRWIVPLEKQYDFLVLANGKKIKTPFDQLIIFSTNLNPADLVDDAFLRRIPYKIHVHNPDEPQFHNLFRFQADRMNMPYDQAMVQYLIDTYYTGQRDFRCCHPRDLLSQIINTAKYKGYAPTMTKEGFDKACQIYFSAMGI